jgi:hypothetical protein
MVGDFALADPKDCFLAKPGRLVLETEVERWPASGGDVVLAREPLFINVPGRSPNLGKANWKSLPLLL